MTALDLRKLVSPEGLAPALAALWHDAHGDWDLAHDACQRAKNRDGDWVHAYLHRKEGDLSNAEYWYVRAGRSSPASSVSLDAEWTSIVESLLKK